jgi:putative glycosyltransferase (TIGR04348 family)
MVDLPRIGIVAPARAESNNGNWHTAARWATHLRAVAEVGIFERWEGQPLDVLIALHARKSAGSVAAFREKRPQGRIVLVMTGTDLYRDLPDDPLARQSIALADRIVVLQPRALDALPAEATAKARVVVQSAPEAHRRPRPGPGPRDTVRFIAIGHLRDVKDPLTLGRAAARLAGVPRIAVEHVGEALDAVLAARLAAVTHDCPNYRWLGGLPHAEVLARLQGADALVHPSRMEGGANAVIEAVQCGVPVLASDVAGNVGLLGEAYEGTFPVGDDAALAALMRRFADDAAFAATLARRCEALRAGFAPAAEAAAVRAVVGELLCTPLPPTGKA